MTYAKRLTQYLLFIIAKLYLTRHHPRIIVVSGSTNRQAVKEAIGERLRKHFTVRISPKNLNAELGVPMSIARIPSGGRTFFGWLRSLGIGLVHSITGNCDDVLILEYAVSHPRDMRYLLRLAHPDCVVLTDVTPEYVTTFGTLEKKAQEYQDLLRHITVGGLAVLNADDARIRVLRVLPNVRAVTYGITHDAIYRGERVATNKNTSTFTLTTPEIQDKTIVGDYFGKSAIYAYLAAEAVFTHAHTNWKKN